MAGDQMLRQDAQAEEDSFFFHAVGSDWEGALLIFQNGRFLRQGHADQGAWLVAEKRLTLIWDSELTPEPLSSNDGGLTFTGELDCTFTLAARTVPAWWLSLFQDDDFAAAFRLSLECRREEEELQRVLRMSAEQSGQVAQTSGDSPDIGQEALEEHICDQCGRISAEGSVGHGDPAFEGQWYCISCWHDFNEQTLRQLEQLQQQHEQLPVGELPQPQPEPQPQPQLHQWQEQEPAQEQEPVQEPAEEPMQEPAQELAQEPTQEPTQEAPATAAEDIDAEETNRAVDEAPAQEPPQEPAQQPAQEPAAPAVENAHVAREPHPAETVAAALHRVRMQGVHRNFRRFLRQQEAHAGMSVRGHPYLSPAQVMLMAVNRIEVPEARVLSPGRDAAARLDTDIDDMYDDPGVAEAIASMLSRSQREANAAASREAQRLREEQDREYEESLRIDEEKQALAILREHEERQAVATAQDSGRAQSSSSTRDAADAPESCKAAPQSPVNSPHEELPPEERRARQRERARLAAEARMQGPSWITSSRPNSGAPPISELSVEQQRDRAGEGSSRSQTGTATENSSKEDTAAKEQRSPQAVVDIAAKQKTRLNTATDATTKEERSLHAAADSAAKEKTSPRAVVDNATTEKNDPHEALDAAAEDSDASEPLPSYEEIMTALNAQIQADASSSSAAGGTANDGPDIVSGIAIDGVAATAAAAASSASEAAASVVPANSASSNTEEERRAQAELHISPEVVRLAVQRLPGERSDVTEFLADSDESEAGDPGSGLEDMYTIDWSNPQPAAAKLAEDCTPVEISELRALHNQELMNNLRLEKELDQVRALLRERDVEIALLRGGLSAPDQAAAASANSVDFSECCSHAAQRGGRGSSGGFSRRLRHQELPTGEAVAGAGYESSCQKNVAESS